MILNGSTLNGSVLNGSNEGNYGSAALAGSSAVTALAFILSAATCSVPASGAVVTAGVYNIDMASAVVTASSQVDVQSTAYVLRIPDLSIDASASISLDTQQDHESGTSIAGSAELIPFQGEGSAISGSATLSVTAELGKATEAKAQDGNAAIVASAILHADGTNPIIGEASIDAVPSMDYAGDGFTTHDGYVRVNCSANLALPSDPLHKIAEIVNGGFLGDCNASANSTVSHAGVSLSSCKATVESSPIIDLYYQASILFPSATVQAQAHLLKNNAEIIPISAESICYFTGSGLIFPSININSESSVVANAGNGRASIATMAVNGVLIADGNGYLGGVADIAGSNTVLANMVSNPRAHAASKRTLIVDEERRSFEVRSEDRTIIVRGS